ncbi:MAG: leucine-rich repeat protein [Lachnospiraceae bacterium]
MYIAGILAALFVTMLAGPIAASMLYYKKRKGGILSIQQNRVRNARYFGQSFSRMVEKNLSNAEGQTITLSRPEPFLDGKGQKEWTGTVEKMVISQERDFCPSTKITEFLKEIYCSQNAFFYGAPFIIRAVYAKKSMYLGNGISLVRWADAEETLTVGDNCELGISVSAKDRMCIGYGCQFRRMYAPEIFIGQRVDSLVNRAVERDPKIYYMPVMRERRGRIRYVSQDMAGESGTAEFTVTSGSSVTVTENMVIQGDVRSHKSVRLCDYAVVCGSIFAENDVYLGKMAIVLGNIFCQGSIHTDEGAVIGRKGKICSVIARDHIDFGKDNVVFGYVSCEKGGKTVKQGEPSEEKPVLLEKMEHIKELSFDNLTDYKHALQLGFRKEKELARVSIIHGAEEISDSMFFDCKNLETVTVPQTLKRVGNYSFADCIHLKEFHHFYDTHIEWIGTAAFENCRELTEIRFPETVQSIGGAAFAGCEGIKKMEFPEQSVLKEIGDHGFRGCRKLEELVLPDSVNRIGISAFSGCDSLRQLSIPAACEQEPGILELREQEGLQIILRDVRPLEEVSE